MINKISKNKKATIILLTLLFISSLVLSLTSVATPVLAESNNVLTNMADVQSRMSSDIVAGGNGTISAPYFDKTWSDRILITVLVKRGNSENYYLQINIDPRQRGAIADDIIVEYRYYSKTHTLGVEKNIKLPNFRGDIKYWDEVGNYLSADSFDKSNDSEAGFTRSSGHKNVENVTCKVSYKFNTNPDEINELYFTFGAKEIWQF